MKLQDWANGNLPADNLIYRDGYWKQIMFIRDVIGGLLADKRDHTYEEYEAMISVIGTHKSKSVLLPVYVITWKRGVRFVLRYNFYDWKVSVESGRPLTWNFDGLFDAGATYSAAICEGFPESSVFRSFDFDARRFTCSIADDYRLFAFLHLVKQQFPIPLEVSSGPA